MPSNRPPANGQSSQTRNTPPIQLLYTVSWMATVLYIVAKVLPYWMPITLVGQGTSFISHGQRAGQVTSSYYFYNEQTGQVRYM